MRLWQGCQAEEQRSWRGEKRPLQDWAPSKCSRHACLETVHSLRNDVFRDILVDESIIHVQFCLGFLNSRCQVVDEYCKYYWSQVGPLRDASGNRVGF